MLLVYNANFFMKRVDTKALQLYLRTAFGPVVDIANAVMIITEAILFQTLSKK